MPVPPTRRTVLAGTVAAAGLVFVGRIPARAADHLVDFPSQVALFHDQFANWDEVILTDPLPTCAPQSTADLLAVVNWAHQHQFTVRPRGRRHSWAPLTVAAGATSADRIIMVDTTHLDEITQIDDHTIRAGAGALVESVLSFAGRRDLGVSGAPAPGRITVGGALAINGHGTGVPARGETRQAHQSYGSLSNHVLALTAVVWDAEQGAYVARRFARNHPDCVGLLTHLGRSFILDVDLQVMQDQNWHCRNRTNIHVNTLFAAPDRAGSSSLSRLIDKHGRVGIIWYAFTDWPWVQTWTTSPAPPLLARWTVGPYNYLFADNLPKPVADLLEGMVSTNPALAPLFCQGVLDATIAGLGSSLALDMWGPSRHFIHFVKETTLRVTAGSHAVLVRRADLQQLVHDFTTFYRSLLSDYRQAGRYPINSGMEIRTTGVDRPEEVSMPGAQTPGLSAAAPDPAHPERDTVVWLDILTVPETEGHGDFYREVEDWIAGLPTDRYTVRPEWSKRWGHAQGRAWTDPTAVQRAQDALPQWDTARAILDRHDPHHLFRSPVTDYVGLT